MAAVIVLVCLQLVLDGLKTTIEIEKASLETGKIRAVADLDDKSGVFCADDCWFIGSSISPLVVLDDEVYTLSNEPAHAIADLYENDAYGEPMFIKKVNKCIDKKGRLKIRTAI